MNSSLDEMLEDLRRSPVDADLSQVGPRTWRRIDQIRHARSLEAWLLPARAGVVVFALTAGAALGAAHARETAERPEVAVFQVVSELAPSTLLDKR